MAALPVCAWKALVDPSSGSTYYAHNTGATTWTRPAEMDAYEAAVAAANAAAATPSVAVSAEPVPSPALQPNTPSKRPPPPLPAASTATPPISTRALGGGSNAGSNSGSGAPSKAASPTLPANAGPAVDAGASLDAPDTSVPSIIDVPGTSWSQVLDAATGKFYYANKETYAVDWEVPAEVLAAQLAATKLGSRSSLSSMVVPEDDVAVLPGGASASARSSTSSTNHPNAATAAATSSLPASARGSTSSSPPQSFAPHPGHQRGGSSINSYAAPTHDFGVVHEFHRVLDAAGTGLFYYVHMQTGAVQWNVPESWKQVQAMEAQMLSHQTSALPSGNNRANFTTAPAALHGLPQGRQSTSKSLSETEEVTTPNSAVSAVRPGLARAPTFLPGAVAAPTTPSGMGSGPHPPPAREGRGPPPGPAPGMGSGGPRPPPLPHGPNPHAAAAANAASPRPPSGPPPSAAAGGSGGFLSPHGGGAAGAAAGGGGHGGGHHHSNSSISSIAGLGVMFPNSPSSSASSTPKVGGLMPMSPAAAGAASSPASPAIPALAPHAPEPTLIKNVLAGPPGGTQQYGPDGKPVALLSSIADDIRNFALKGYASNHFRTFKKRTGIVSRTNIDVDELLSWQKTVIAKSLLTSTKKYTSDAVSLFKKILSFMGDAGVDASKKSPALLAGEIVALGVKHPPMRDEIYCQLAKQTKLNPEPLSTAAGWKLMALCCATWAPTRAFQDHLMGYFIENFRGATAANSSARSVGSMGSASSSSSSKGGGSAHVNSLAPSASLGDALGVPAILSRYCFWKVSKTIKDGADEKLTLSMVDEMASKGVRSFQVLFPGNLEYIVHCQTVEKNTTSVAIPEIMIKMCEQIRAGGGFQAKGIFRIAAQREHVTAARARIESGRWDLPSNGHDGLDPHTPADVLKVWLRELLTPVIPMNLYDQALKLCDNEAECVALVQRELSPIHYAALDYLLTFLAELSTHQKDTMMNDENLAIVFSQDLLRTDEKDPVVLYKNSQREKNFVKQLIAAWGKKAGAASA